MTIGDYKAEVALGAENRLIRQMSFEVRGQDRGGSKQRFTQRVAVILWDLNASDIAVRVPAPEELFDLEGLVTPNLTTTPAEPPTK